MQFTIKNLSAPVNWYRWNVWFSVQLLRSYIRGVEKQIAISIDEYQTQREIQLSEITGSFDDGTGYPDVVETHGGLDSDDWDLPDIFIKHFPSLQRRGALITLYSFFENELNALCELFRKDQNLKVYVTDMQGKGVERAILFLERIVGLEIQKNSVWAGIDEHQGREKSHCA